MPQFKYVARDYSVNKVTGEINAKSDKEARSMLKDKGLLVIEIREIKSKDAVSKSLSDLNLFRPKIKLNDITLFSRQFATLIEAGVPITRSLFILAQNTDNKGLKVVLEDITQDIEDGNPLSVALFKYRHIFPSIYIDMVSAAEMGGVLPEILNRLASYMENDRSIKGKVRSAFIYPTAVMIVAIAVVIAMMVFVIPKFIPLFEGLGAELPLPTRILIGLSGFMQNYWWVIILSIILFVIGVGIYSKTSQGRYVLDYIKIRIPVIGVIVRKSAISKFCRTLETLQRSGVPIMQSLTLVGKTSGNSIVEKATIKALESLQRGEGMATPLEQTKVFPILVTQMIAIGEETGELEELLSKIADFYEEEVSLAVKNLTALIEPIITVFLAVVVGFIAIAIIVPMYNMMGALRNNM